MEIVKDVMEEEQEPTAPDDDEQEATMTTEIGTIWEDDMIDKYICGSDGRKKWRCLWCSYESFKWNATKIIAHLVKRRG